jgi:hypothetical protein
MDEKKIASVMQVMIFVPLSDLEQIFRSRTHLLKEIKQVYMIPQVLCQRVFRHQPGMICTDNGIKESRVIQRVKSLYT